MKKRYEFRNFYSKHVHEDLKDYLNKKQPSDYKILCYERGGLGESSYVEIMAEFDTGVKL